MYQDLEAQLHDIFWEQEPDANELPLLKSFLNKFPGKSLEIGCGSGRLLLALLADGYDLDGIELSQDMLSLLTAKAKDRGLEPTVHHGDALTTPLAPDYSSIIIPAFTLQLLPRPEALRLLKKLRPPQDDRTGLYISTFIPWAEITEDLEPGVWYTDKATTTEDGGSAKCETKHHIDRVNQELQREHRYSLSYSNTTTRKHHSEQSLQWYLLPELKLMLESAGWEIDSWHADFTHEHQDSDASTITIFASNS